MSFSILEIFSAFMVLFAVIDIIGSIPIVLNLKQKGNTIESGKASLVALSIMLIFLFIGEALLGLFGVDISSFAIAGSFILFFLSLEMILGIELFKGNTEGGASLVPIAFPVIAGAGSMTTLLALRAEYAIINIVIALVLNIFVVYIVLRSTQFIEKHLGKGGVLVLRKAFGIILLAIAVKLFITNVGASLSSLGNVEIIIHQ